MKRATTQRVVAGGVAVGLVLTGAALANALWNASTRISVPSFPVGSVAFGAYPSSSPQAMVSSTGGEAVTVVLPGSRLAELLTPPEEKAEPLIWRFTARGSALGIAGMDYDVEVREQRFGDDVHDLASGHAQPNTVLGNSTMKIYRAGLGGDCSAIPALPDDADGRNIYVFDGDDHVLQEPGAGIPGESTEQEWCAAVEWNAEEDGRYRNSVQVVAVTDNGARAGAVDDWHSLVGIPPALDMVGTYRSFAEAEGVGENGASVTGRDAWEADLYPDGSTEPDVVIALRPTVTNLNPDFSPSP
ncbi:hypothetical protein [Microbacterium imperiale]|uniref:Uncharacterized protein n=1 Tax=Microbacterium imperiale TaxID=33884 RepID=A0A9W6M2U4_9MICO|nr:hypothetical protein [Microbacterium imperiale]MBP2420484.1 hypothetical protein [Microbacterium imperiale]MDS0200570.1 hypothetical protein [Microbacterium imperiale]BFE40825.1 hypothetical protein GCM10017544_17810 [Microbacterium imperiale]GLJ79888.1 hypothetical protein GCM10017586_15710 [Microbacterium imperiale]